MSSDHLDVLGNHNVSFCPQIVMNFEIRALLRVMESIEAILKLFDASTVPTPLGRRLLRYARWDDGYTS